MRSLGLFAFTIASLSIAACGSDGAPGPKGDPGPAGTGVAGDPSVSAVVPNKAFLARTVDVTISGFGTKWDEATKVDFGPGVTVDKVTVASPTALVASITIDKAANAGTRDVTVDAGGAKVIYKGAFRVDSPLSLVLKGQVAQGSIVIGTAQGKDLSTPFDTTSQGGGLFGPPEFTGVKVSDIGGATPLVSNVSLYSVDFSFTVDVTAAPGVKPFSLVSGAEGAPKVDFPYPEGIDIKPRQPTVLTAGTPVQGSIAKPFDSVLYQITPSAGLNLVELRTQTSTPNARPSLVVLPKSGKFSDLVSNGASNLLVSTAADPYFVILWDGTGTAGYQATVGAVVTPATGAAEAANNDTCATGQVATSLPFVLQGATLSSDTDEDWIRVTIGAGDANKKLRIRTLGGDPKTDTVVQLFQSDGTTSVAGPSNDQDYHENLLSPALAAGTYCVKISASPSFVATANAYQAVLRLE